MHLFFLYIFLTFQRDLRYYFFYLLLNTSLLSVFTGLLLKEHLYILFIYCSFTLLGIIFLLSWEFLLALLCFVLYLVSIASKKVFETE